MIVKFRIRRDTAADWTTNNPTLGVGEPGLETDTRRVKYGDGVTAWTSLEYADDTGSLKLPSYTVAGVPSASTHGAGAMIYVTDEAGGATPAFSDGLIWRRISDRALIS